MKVTYNAEERILKVVTDIDREVVEEGLAELTACDDKGNELYRITIKADGKGSISEFGLGCNTYSEGKAAYIEVMPIGTTLLDVKKQYSKALLAAAKYGERIAIMAARSVQTIDNLFTPVITDAPCTVSDDVSVEGGNTQGPDWLA